MSELNDAKLFAWIRENLYVAVVCDILDDLGYNRQAMHYRLRPLDPECAVMVGRARTFRWMDADYVNPGNPYGLEIEAMDSLRENDVVVHSTDYARNNAPWGELMTTAAKMRKAAGCICDSQIRDCLRIMAMKFPVFYSGIKPVDSKGRGLVVAYDVPVMCGDVLVKPCDLIYTDFDGIVVVPAEVEEQVFAMAAEKAGRENLSRAALLEGKTLREVYDTYGAL